MTASATALRPVRNPSQRRQRSALSRFVRRHERAVYGGVGVLAFLLFWEFGSNAGFVDEFFFSRPSAIVLAGINEVQLPRFWNDLKVSAW